MVGDSGTPEPVLDLDGTLARLGGDRNLFAEIVAMMLEDAPRVYANLRGAVAAKDAEAVRTHAHGLKGLFAGCGGVRAARAAQSVEDAGETANLDQAVSLLGRLDNEFNDLTHALRQFRA
jgi:HPt (histidine-containing phosphotransfer) domain-containing protein